MSNYKSYSLTRFIYNFLYFLRKNIVLLILFLGFITERIYQNNMVGIPHLIEYIVAIRRMHKHQDIVVKHLESSSYFSCLFYFSLYACINK